MSYPAGSLIRILAERILLNLEYVERCAPAWGAPEQDQPPYADTQLLISLLGVLVFPQERTPDALGALMSEFDELSQMVTVQHPRNGGDKIELFGAYGDSEAVDPASVKDLPKLLRNSIAHFNIRPIDKKGRFGGVRVWNKNGDDITLVADLDFDKLRPFAHYVLKKLAYDDELFGLGDPPDPLETIAKQPRRLKQKKSKPPRLGDHVWNSWLTAHGGDWNAAKDALDRLVKKSAVSLLNDQRKAST